METYRSLLKDYFAARPDPKALQSHVNEQMAAWEEQEGRSKREASEKARTPDEEGFVTVSDPRPFLSKHARAAGDEGLDEQATVADFYKFQTRQSRVSQLDELRRKFEQDKAQIAQLRRNKIFDKA